MFRFTWLFFIGFLAGGWVNAQEGHRIEVTLENYDSDTLMLAYYFWDKQYIKDTAYRENEKFVFANKDTLPSGIYMLVTQPQNDIIQIVVSEEDQHFALHANADSLNTSVSIEGCEENQQFYDYLEFLSTARKRSQVLQKLWGDQPDPSRAGRYPLDPRGEVYRNRR